MTAATESVELIGISDDDDCSSVVSQSTSDIIIIEEVVFHNDQEISERSSKRKRRTKTIDIYFTSASRDSSKLVSTKSCDTSPTADVVNSRNNGDQESNQISVSPGPSFLPPEGITFPIEEISAVVSKPSHTDDVENANDGVLRKGNEEKMKKTDSHKKMVNEEEWQCNTCHPPVHTCKKFANVLGNSHSTNNISKPKNVFLTKNDFECDVCLKGYSWKRSLDRHRLTHSDPGTWNKCPFCVYKTPYLDVLKVHLRKHVTPRRSEKTEKPKRETFSPKTAKVKKERRSKESNAYWDCTYCNKEFQLAKRCEQHELCCEKEINPLIDPRLLTIVKEKRMSLRKLR